MSLINDALIKAERDRADAAIADGAHRPPFARAEKLRHQKRRRSLAPVMVNVGVLVGIFAALIVLALRPGASKPTADGVGATALIIDRPAPEPIAVPPPQTASPFAPPAPEAPAPPAPASSYALAGMSMLGQETLISVLRRSDQRSVWIPVGRSVGGISAVSYDAEKDQAVIRVGEELLTIGMNSDGPGLQPAE